MENSKQPTLNPLFTDCPIQCEEEDLLNRSGLVEDIIAILKNNGDEASFTIGISGPWGSGKTSLSNLIESGLKEDEELHFFHFTPWVYSDHEKLVNTFLNEFRTLIEPRSKKICKKITRVGKRIGCTSAPIVSCVSPLLGELLAAYSNALSSSDSERTIKELKDEISKEIKNNEKKIIIVIDDIDRLDGAEIATVLKLVRAIADFPRMIYVLLYDVAHVIKSLNARGYDGEDFLCKIIQLPIQLPLAGEEAINELITIGYGKITESDVSVSPQLIMGEVLKRTETMRDAKRLMNIFAYTYSICKNEINPMDLLGLSCLQMKYKEAFDWLIEVKSEKNLLRGISESLSDRLFPVGDKESKWQTLRQKYEEDQGGRLPGNAIGLISELFPNFIKSRSLTDDEMEHLKERCICSDLYFWNYFRLVPSPISLSKDRVKHLAMDADHSEICEEIVRSRWSDKFLSEILAYIHENKERLEYYLKILMCNNDLTTDGFVDTVGVWNPYGEMYFDYYLRLKSFNPSDLVEFITENFPSNDVNRVFFAANMLRSRIYGDNASDPKEDSIEVKKIKNLIEDRIKTCTEMSVRSKYYFQIPQFMISDGSTQDLLRRVVKTDDDLYYLFDRIKQILDWNKGSEHHWVVYLPHDRVESIVPRDEEDRRLIEIVRSQLQSYIR